MGKERYPGDIGDLWEDDPTRLLEYVQEQKSVLVLTNGKSVPVGRSFATAARSRFGPGLKSAQAD